MNFEELYIRAYDRLSLYVKMWLPREHPVGVIILIHGLGEHINRYNHWSKRFNNDDWAVVGFDLRGHGHSDGKRGYGNYQSHLNDIDSIFALVRERFGSIPTVLYGHSMGGNLALGYEIFRKPDIQRLVVTSPWLKLVFPPPTLLEMASKLIARLFPRLSVSNGLSYRYISRDKSVCDDYRRDPLVHDRITISAFLQMQEWASVILKNKHKINVPLLLLHGKDDKITSWKGSYQLAVETSENTKFKLWDNCFHELHNELNKDEVYDFISFWLSNMKLMNQQTYVS